MAIDHGRFIAVTFMVISMTSENFGVGVHFSHQELDHELEEGSEYGTRVRGSALAASIHNWSMSVVLYNSLRQRVQSIVLHSSSSRLLKVMCKPPLHVGECRLRQNRHDRTRSGDDNLAQTNYSTNLTIIAGVLRQLSYFYNVSNWRMAAPAA